MHSLTLHFRKLDWILIISAVLLVAFGLLSIYSSSLGRADFFNFQKQLIFAGAGVFLMLLFSFFDYRIIRNDPYLMVILYGLVCLALLGLFFFAPAIRGVKSWYDVGPVSVDPREFIKLILIALLAKYFSVRHVEMYRVSHILFSGLYVLLPAVLIFFQPDLGSVIILAILWLAILIFSGIKLRSFLILIFCGLLALSLSWSFLLKDYQKERVTSFIVADEDPLGSGWNEVQSKIAIGSGGIFGQGLGSGPQTQYGFLPEPQTDFIFAAIAEEFGLAGVAGLLALFGIFIFRIIKVSLSASGNFAKLFASGFAVLVIAQIFINIGMNIGVLPIVGVPLPLISYGGSSLLMIFIGLGIIQNIKVNQ
ncbi:MAG: rod shape-determining protein RodA [Candidatus Paceibacterota bacterium]|jgi:rod shape determining protein RodA